MTFLKQPTNTIAILLLRVACYGAPRQEIIDRLAYLELASQTTPETGTKQFFYDSKRRIDYKLDGKGQKTQMIYDTGGRVPTR